MALITIETTEGPRQVRVCDYCKTVCIPNGRFCSGHCARQYGEMLLQQAFCADTAHLRGLVKYGTTQ